MERIISFKSNNQEALEKSLNIRRKVFIEEQEVPEDLEMDQHDIDSKHYLYIIDSKPVATARYRIINDRIKLERFAVLKEYRKSGLGVKLLNKILMDLKDQKEKIYLHAQDSAVGFYLKNGFHIFGEGFPEAGILHFSMKLKNQETNS